MFIVTHVWILTSNLSTIACRFGFSLVRTLSYRSLQSLRFRHIALVPIIFGANPLDRSAITHCLNGGCL